MKEKNSHAEKNVGSKAFQRNPQKIATNLIATNTMKPKKLNLLILPALAAFTASAHAASYIGTTYEGFDYPVGTVSGANGGTGWNATGDDSLANTTSSWTTQASAAVTAGGLSYSGTTGYSSSSGNKLTMTPTAATDQFGSARAFRNLGQTVATNSVGSLYFSFLMQKTNVTNRTLNLAFFNGTTELFNIGQNNSASGNLGTLGVNFGGLNYPTSALTLGNDMHLIIGKLDFEVSSSMDRITLWVNPMDITGGEGSLTPYLTVDSNLTTTGLDSIRLFAGQTSGGFNAVTGNFDEIRVGSSFASVIPEPSTALLGGLGLLALLRRRRA